MARLVGSDGTLLAERWVCSIADLPVLSSQRSDGGAIVETVKDDWGLIEVRRDAVGRFISARPVEMAAGE